MAAKGTFAAYAPLRAVGEQTSKNIQQAEYMGFRYRQEEAEKKKRKQDWVGKILEQTGAAREDLRYNNVGIEGVDVPVARMLMKDKETLNELEQNLLSANPDSDEAIQSQMKLSRLKASVKDIHGFANMYRERKEAFDPEKHSGYLFQEQTSAINDRLQRGKYNLFRDKNYNLMMAFYDEDGEINPDLPVVNVTEANKNGLPPLRDKVTRKDALTGIASEFGTVETEEDLDGNITEKYSGFDPENIPALQQRVDEFLGEDKASMTPAAKSILADDIGFTDIEDMSEEEFTKFKTDLSNAIVRKFDKTKSTTEDRGLTLQERRFNYQKEQDALDREERASKPTKGKEDKDKGKGEINVVTAEDGSYVDDTGAVTFSIRDGVEVGDNVAHNFKVADGEIVLTGQRPSEIKGFGEPRPLTVTDDTEMTQYVIKIPNPETGQNFRNLAEFKKYARKKENQYGLESGMRNTNPSNNEGYGTIDELPDFTN